MIMFQGFRAVQDTLSSLSEVLASPADGAEAGDSEDEAERGRDQGAGEGVQEGEAGSGQGEEEEEESEDCSQPASSLSSDRGTVLDCLTRTPWYRAYTHQEEDSQEATQVPGQVLYVEDQEAEEEYREGGYHPVAVGEVFQVNCYQQNEISRALVKCSLYPGLCCKTIHRLHNRFSQSRIRPLLGPSPC